MLGYKVAGPYKIVNNAVDETIFNSAGKVPFDRKRKIRIVASSWSAGERKVGRYQLFHFTVFPKEIKSYQVALFGIPDLNVP